MGIYDRGWYREQPRINTPRVRSMVVTLIIINVAAFLLSSILVKLFNWDPVHHGLGLVPDDVVRRFMIWEIVTSMFLHDGLYHLLINMLVLFMFGSGVEQRIGRGPFLRLYFGAGILAGLAYVVFGLFGAPFVPAVGASGAVMGLVVYFTMLNPKARVLFFFIIPMQMIWVTALLISMDLYWFVFAPPGGTGVAHTAHLGGALFGFLYYRYAHRIDFFFLKLEAKDKKRSATRSTKERDRLRREVDRLLDKVSAGGLDALSDREKKTLKTASERLKELDR